MTETEISKLSLEILLNVEEWLYEDLCIEEDLDERCRQHLLNQLTDLLYDWTKKGE